MGALNSLLITLLLLCVSYLITSRFVGWSGLTMTLVIGIVWAVTAFLFFNYASLFIPIVPVLLAIVVGYIGSVTHNVIYEEREKKKIKSMFSSYVSPELVDKMISDEFDYTLGGREDELTVMFSDIEDFTTLSESLSPRELVSMINSYLNTFTEVINEENGTLDKYIGDAVMAIYGAPVPIENQAACACRTVLKTEQKWEKQSYNLMGVQIRTRYGINTGPMLVGNMGSERRFNYTVMGDQVNLAARCESACKIFGVYAIVSESTKIQAEKTKEFVFRKLGKVRVKGRNKSVVLYQLVGFTDQYNLSVLNLIKQFELALDLYFDRKFAEALSIFEKLISKEVANFHVNKNLNPSLFYAGLCREFIENTPENDWSGVIER
jgi:adenylate cyclase